MPEWAEAARPHARVHGADDYDAPIKEVGLIGFDEVIDDCVFDEYVLEPPIYRV